MNRTTTHAIVLNDERFIAEAHVVACLANLYAADNAHKLTVAALCDDWLDPTGRLGASIQGCVMAQATPRS